VVVISVLSALQIINWNEGIKFVIALVQERGRVSLAETRSEIVFDTTTKKRLITSKHKE
jgi:hypothetical protein